MKNLRISFNSFEKSMKSFVEKRIIGSEKYNYKSEHEFPLSLKKTKVGDNLVHFDQLFERPDILEVSKRLINSYKLGPFSNKSGYTIQPKEMHIFNGKFKSLENPVRNYLMSWNFDGDFLYFKFFIRFKNGHKNKKFKQMKIKIK